VFGQTGAGIFSLIQILFAWSDIEAADKAKHAFPNLVGAVITAVLGKLSAPWLLSAYAQYRGEPLAERPANPQASPARI